MDLSYLMICVGAAAALFLIMLAAIGVSEQPAKPEAPPEPPAKPKRKPRHPQAKPRAKKHRHD
jgi:hypothetical protein